MSQDSQGQIRGEAAKGDSPGVPRGNVGATPSNTAPSKYNSLPPDGFQCLGSGIDSLYLSYSGELDPGVEKQLNLLKSLAQGAQALGGGPSQIEVAEHHFEVSPKGAGKFRFVLTDNHYRVQVAGTSKSKLPMAYVQVSSDLCHAVSVDSIDHELRSILDSLGTVNSQAAVSRLDLHVDFQTELIMEDWDQKAWVCRADKVDSRFRAQSISGWVVGAGGAVMARLYDKTREIGLTGKRAIEELWRATRWEGTGQVWRLEFQLRREALRELGLVTVDDIEGAKGAVWRYCTENWLRLAVINESDPNRARWPTHPLWLAIQQCPDWSAKQPAIRVPPASRAPADHYLMLNGLAPLTSFMAREGITDIVQASRAFVAAATRFHAELAGGDPAGLRHYVNRQVSKKRVRYNLPPLRKPGEKDDG